MKREELYQRLEEGPLILDGATGSNLQKAGMPAGVCPEQWILDHPQALIKLQSDFARAGTDIVYAPTFSANRVKLAEYGLEPYIAEYSDEESGESYKLMAGLKLDSVTALKESGAFLSDGAYLCVTMNGGNIETTMKALEVMMRDLTEGKYAQPEDTEPTA